MGKTMAKADEAQSIENWSKYSLGSFTSQAAARVLLAASDGNWLVREDRNKKLVFSYRQGDKVEAAPITDIGAKGLDRTKLLQPGQVRTLLKSVSSRPPGRTTQESKGRETESQKKPRARQSTTAPRRTTQESEGRGSETREKPKMPPPTQGLDESLNKAMRAKKGWQGDMNRATAEALLKDRPGAWLLREGRDGLIAFSYNDNGRLRHALISNMKNYTDMQTYTAKFAVRVIPKVNS